MITVNFFLELICQDSPIQFWANGDTYEFPNFFNIPDEILELTIEGIDNPYYNMDINHPICINVDSDNFIDYELFKKENKDYLISE